MKTTIHQTWAILPTVKTDTQTKDVVYAVCKAKKINYSAVVNSLLRQWISGEIDVKISVRDENGFTPEKAARIHSLIKDVKDGKNLITHQELIESIEKARKAA